MESVGVREMGEGGPATELEKQMWELAAQGFLTWNGGPFRVPEPAAVNPSPELPGNLIVENRERSSTKPI